MVKKTNNNKELTLIKKNVAKIMALLHNDNPQPRCELYYESPYQLLVSVVLSAQTTDIMVNRCMREVYQKGFTPQTISAWGEAKFLQLIRPIGLAPTKAKNIYRLTQILLEKHNGEVPATRQELEFLPGVGRKTASVVLGELFAAKTLAVDTHVFRVTGRLGLHAEKTPSKAEVRLLAVIDEAFLPAAHHHFVLLGRYICKSRKPECERCLLVKLCCYANRLATCCS